MSKNDNWMKTTDGNVVVLNFNVENTLGRDSLLTISEIVEIAQDIKEYNEQLIVKMSNIVGMDVKQLMKNRYIIYSKYIELIEILETNVKVPGKENDKPSKEDHKYQELPADKIKNSIKYLKLDDKQKILNKINEIKELEAKKPKEPEKPKIVEEYTFPCPFGDSCMNINGNCNGYHPSDTTKIRRVFKNDTA